MDRGFQTWFKNALVECAAELEERAEHRRRLSWRACLRVDLAEFAYALVRLPLRLIQEAPQWTRALSYMLVLIVVVPMWISLGARVVCTSARIAREMDTSSKKPVRLETPMDVLAANYFIVETHFWGHPSPTQTAQTLRTCAALNINHNT
jgi:hypothetical protein